MPPKRGRPAAKLAAPVTGKRKNTDHGDAPPAKRGRKPAATNSAGSHPSAVSDSLEDHKVKRAAVSKKAQTTAKKPATTKAKPASKSAAEPAPIKTTKKAASKKRSYTEMATEPKDDGANLKSGDTTESDSQKVVSHPQGNTSESEQANGEMSAEKPESNSESIKNRAKVAEKRKVEDPYMPKKFAKTRRARMTVNEVPTQVVEVFVCGEGEMGELGLGTGDTALGVRRPRLNPLLGSKEVGVVAVALGGMHCLAITKENTILSWGVNDQGALGRDTKYSGGLVDADQAAQGQQDDENNGLNPLEANPTAIPSEYFPPDAVFVGVAAGDSCSFAWTTTGIVFGWGTFRDQAGDSMFAKGTKIQHTPTQIPDLKRITKVVCGSDHVLALDVNGAVSAWGRGDKSQLGRRIVARTSINTLKPHTLTLPKKSITNIGSGAYHSFAIDKDGNTWAWGNNSTCQCADPEGAGESDQTIDTVRRIENLKGLGMKAVDGGNSHSVGIDGKGNCIVWGRADTGAMGLDWKSLPEEHLIRDGKGNPRVVVKPAAVPNIGTVSGVCASGDTTLCVNNKGHAYGFGFSMSYQTGTGSDDDVEIATRIKSKGITDEKKVHSVGVGGNFAIFTSLAEDMVMTNGTAGGGSPGH